MTGSLYEIAREVAGDWDDVPSHAQLKLEQLVDHFVECRRNWDTFRLEVDHRALQLQDDG